jgi:hypothetical protein
MQDTLLHNILETFPMMDFALGYGSGVISQLGETKDAKVQYLGYIWLFLNSL